MARWQYPSKTEPVSTESETILLDKWLPSYSDTLPVKQILSSAIHSGSSFFVYSPGVLIDKWMGSYPSKIDAVKRSNGYGQFTESPFPVEISTIDKWLSTYPNRLDPARKPFWSGEFKIDLRPIIYIDNWQPNYPSKIDSRRPTPQDYQVTPYLDHIPETEVLSLDKWKPNYPDRFDPRRRPFWQGVFTSDSWLANIPVVEDLTLDKWMGSYPSRLDRKRGPFWQGCYTEDSKFIFVPAPPPMSYGDIRHCFVTVGESMMTQIAVLETIKASVEVGESIRTIIEVE
jgi:hypothetical protein